MDTMLLVMIIGTLAVFAIGAWSLYRTWHKGREGRLSATSYRAFIALGVVWLITGSGLTAASLALDVPPLYALPLFALGAIYVLIGLLNRHKWQ